MATAWEPVLHIKTAMRGANGTTEIKGARRFRVGYNVVTKTSRHGGSAMPNRVFKEYAAPVVQVEIEDDAEEYTHITAETAAAAEKLVFTYKTSNAAARTRTFERVDPIDIEGRADFPPAEDPNIPTRIIQFAVVEKTIGDTWANSMTRT